MNRTEGLIVPKGKKFTQKEVNEIIEGIAHGAKDAM